jgi:hypothetical protein
MSSFIFFIIRISRKLSVVISDGNGSMQWIWSFQAYYQIANIFTVGLALGQVQVYYQKREFGVHSYFRNNHFRNVLPPFKRFREQWIIVAFNRFLVNKRMTLDAILNPESSAEVKAIEESFPGWFVPYFLLSFTS